MNFVQGLAAEAHWVWIAIGLLLCAAEIFTPGVFLIFIGLAAIVTGLLLIVAPLSLTSSLLVFCAFSVATVFAGRRFYGANEAESDNPYLNRRAEAMIGKIFPLAEAIKGGEGAIRVSDTRWRVRGPDMPSGVRVRVTGVEDATVLRVEQE